MADNDDAYGSRHKPFWEMTIEMAEQPQRHYEGIGDDSTDPEYTTASDVGDDTSDDNAAEDATATDDGIPLTEGSQSKRRRKDRHPNVLDTVKEEFTKVSKSGHPMAPTELVVGYVGQLGCILRSTVVGGIITP